MRYFIGLLSATLVALPISAALGEGRQMRFESYVVDRETKRVAGRVFRNIETELKEIRSIPSAGAVDPYVEPSCEKVKYQFEAAAFVYRQNQWSVKCSDAQDDVVKFSSVMVDVSSYSVVVNEQGERIGWVDAVVENSTTGDLYVVTSVGAFLGIGRRSVLIPVEDLTERGDFLSIPLSEDQLEAFAEFNYDSEYVVLEPSQHQ